MRDVCFHSTNEDIHLKDEIPDATESNTTKSFVEHEKDIECTDELKDITLKCFSVSLDDVLIDCNGKTEEIEASYLFKISFSADIFIYPTLSQVAE